MSAVNAFCSCVCSEVIFSSTVIIIIYNSLITPFSTAQHSTASITCVYRYFSTCTPSFTCTASLDKIKGHNYFGAK